MKETFIYVHINSYSYTFEHTQTAAFTGANTIRKLSLKLQHSGPPHLRPAEIFTQTPIKQKKCVVL